MKLQDIEALLNLPHKVEMNIKDLNQNAVCDLARYFGSDVKTTMFGSHTTIKRNDVEITLSTPLELSPTF